MNEYLDEREKQMTHDSVKLTTDMIQNGEHQELYKEYAQKKAQSNNDLHIKYALVEYGYCHDILCNDPMTSVREHVISSDIRYAPKCFNGTRVLWEQIANELTDHKQPKTPDILSIYDWFLQLGTEGLNVHLSNFNKVQYEAIKLIYQAETTVPTTIEKTMTPSQLYLQGSPLWIKSVDWPFSATIIKSTTSKQETAKMIDIMLGN